MAVAKTIVVKIGVLSCFFAVINVSYSLFVAKDLAVYECQTGWGELPPLYNDSLIECNKDLSQTTECRKHCLARKMGLILEGKMWLYKLLDVLKRLYPGQAGKDSVDKMVDVIMECSDKHYKAFGPMTPFHCYREKKMWHCIYKSAETICKANEKHRQEKMKERKKHMDSIVDEGNHDKPKAKQIVLMDY